MEDFSIDSDENCPSCGHSPIHFRNCLGLHCDDGFIDSYIDDPINFYPGEELTFCDECSGNGIEKWCPECGLDICRHELFKGAKS